MSNINMEKEREREISNDKDFATDDYQFLDEDELRKLEKDNPWLDEIPEGSPQSKNLREEIESILNEAEEAKRIAEQQNLINKPIDDAENGEPSAKERVVDNTEINTEVCNSTDVKSNQEEQQPNAQEPESNAQQSNAQALPEESFWSKLNNSTPVTTAKCVAKEAIIAISVFSLFSVVSYVNFHLAEIQ